MSPTVLSFHEPVPECSRGAESKQREATSLQVQLSASPLSFLLHKYFQSQSKLKLVQHLLIAWYPTELSQNQGLIRDPSRGVCVKHSYTCKIPAGSLHNSARRHNIALMQERISPYICKTGSITIPHFLTIL